MSLQATRSPTSCLSSTMQYSQAHPRSQVHTPPPGQAAPTPPAQASFARQPSSDPASARSQTTPPAGSQAQTSSQPPAPENSQADSRARASDWARPADGILKNTPVKPKSSSTVPHGLTQGGTPARDELRRKLNKEMDWVEVPVRDWFKACAPNTKAPPDETVFESWEVPMVDTEPGMYPVVVRHMSSLDDHRLTFPSASRTKVVTTTWKRRNAQASLHVARAT